MTDSLEEDFTKAATLFREKNYIDAIGAYTTLINNFRATPTDKVRAYSNLSACYAARNQYADALDAAKKALQLDDQNAKVHGRVATAYHGLKHYEDAARHYERAHLLDSSVTLYKTQHEAMLELLRNKNGIATQEGRDSYYYNKSIEQGKEAMTKGQYLSAVRHFSKAIELHARCTGEVNKNDTTSTSTNGSGGRYADYAILLCNRSAAYGRAGRYSESLDDAMKAAEVHPMYARAFFRIAYAQHQLKQPLEAHATLRRCLELDPSNKEAKALMEEVEPVVKNLKKSADERQREKQEQVQKIREMQSAEMVTENATTSLAHHKRAHATSYLHCSYCNEAGHSRAECTFLRRKRHRTS